MTYNTHPKHTVSKLNLLGTDIHQNTHYNWIDSNNNKNTSKKYIHKSPKLDANNNTTWYTTPYNYDEIRGKGFDIKLTSPLHPFNLNINKTENENEKDNNNLYSPLEPTIITPQERLNELQLIIEHERKRGYEYKIVNNVLIQTNKRITDMEEASNNLERELDTIKLEKQSKMIKERVDALQEQTIYNNDQLKRCNKNTVLEVEFLKTRDKIYNKRPKITNIKMKKPLYGTPLTCFNTK